MKKLLIYCCVFFIFLGAAHASKSLRKAQALYDVSLKDFNPVGLNRSAALAKKALDASPFETNLLAGKAYYQIAILFYYNNQEGKARDMLEKSIVSLNYANANNVRHIEAAAYRIMAVDMLQITLGKDSEFAGDAAERDIEYLQTVHPKDNYTILVAGMRAFHTAVRDIDPDEMRKANRYFRRLYADSPDNIPYACYYYYSLAKLDTSQRNEAAKIFIEILRKQPKNRMASYLRGKL